MQLFKPFRKQDKQGDTSYSAVEVDADSIDAPNNVRNNVAPPSGWPVKAERVSRYRVWMAIDGLLLILPVAFIALAAVAVKLDGQDVSPYGKHVQEAILLGPTIYPLVFAALGGRALRKIALWRAGEGTTLGFLEHVLGSQSLVATVGYAVTLRTLDILTLTLLMFWALSPLGGQSVLRLLHETNSTITENRSIYYANVDAQSQLSGSVLDKDLYNRGNAVVSTALMTAENLEWTPEDAWSHPKIPRIEDLEVAELKNSTDRSWHTVNSNDTYSYASLAGINVMNLAEQGSTNFTVPYEYMYFNCELSPQSNFSKLTEVDPPQPYPPSLMNYLLSLQNSSKLTTQGWTNTPRNTTSPLFTDNSFFMYTKGTPDKLEALLYGSRYITSLNFFLWECSMNSLMVEANIVCQFDKCAVDRLRRADTQDQKGTLSGFTPYGVTHTWQWNRYFIQALASLGGEASTQQSNPVDAYIFNQTQWAVADVGFLPGQQNWTTYIGEPQKAIDLSHRLTKVLNTYLDSFRWPKAVTLSDPFARKSLNSTGQPTEALTLNSTEAVVSIPIPVYRVNAPWAALLVICSSALLLLGIFGIFVQSRTMAPDIFNHASSLTRDNPHVNAPSGGSGLDGADRARLLKKMRVQLGDAEPQSETGYVAFRSVRGTNECREGRIRKDRLYR
ncbi:hypothetical protein E8E12_002211 [Didymella heteroderae]|uniref:Uncharacterized protein n=1 Tax=Didymella heteroderae TaxID=1769908 RepID=A0A9P4WI15_9PLEO|nr:hypothetical protein E8E12_002211 [Didymella heteroderae]